ncbi:condensation domain-containing protein [Micromonospora sp. LOL_025]|uniref:condensation domain-containing protein n=1 Tax=Micromonospora sp. LOL_025 TaxID=3345413 RepID=UPI003A899A0B
MTGRTHPLSMGQRSMWNLDRLIGGGPVHTLAWRVRLRGALDEGALRDALVAVIDRHEPLRTRFAQDASGPVAIVEDSVDLPLPVDDLRLLPDAARQAALRCAEDVATGFALDRAPLLRARLLRLDDDRYDLLVVVHHIVFDGISLDLLLDDLALAYGGGDRTGLDVSYADAVAEERELLTGQRRVPLAAFWRERLAGAPPVVLPPPDREPAVERSWVSRTCSRKLPDVSAFARGERCMPYVVYLAALNALLSRLTGSSDVVVGTPVSSRHRARFERLVGYFVNTVVLRTEVGDVSFRELVRHQRGVVFDALDHQRLPFEAVVEEVNPGRASGYSPLFQVLFALVEPTRKAVFADLAVDAVEPVDNNRSPFPVTFSVIDDHLQVEYAPALYDDATAARMAEQFATLLDAALADPDGRVGELTAFVPAPARSERPAEDAVQAAAGDENLIRVVQAVWSGHLHTEVTDPDADFVGLGGHSLVASRIAIELRELFGLEEGLSDLTVFRAPTPRLLADHLAAALGENAAAEAEFVLQLLTMTDEQAEAQIAREES